MSRYYLHLRDGASELIDADGAEFVDLATLRNTVLASARELMCVAIKDGLLDLRFRIDAENDKGVVSYSLPFSQAAVIIPSDEPSSTDKA